MTDFVNLGGATPGQLLALYARIIDELLSRGVVRSTNNPVADYSEYLTARALNLTLVANANAGFDAINEDDVRYQVKARRLTARNGSRQLGFIRGLDLPDDPFDLLVGILFESDFRVHRAAIIPMEVVRARAARVEYVNGWRFMLSDAVWTLPGVEDATSAIREAAGQPAVAPAVIQSAAPVSPVKSTGPSDDPIWSLALSRYRTPATLRTLARHRPFEVRASREELVITPETGRPRRVFAAEFLKVVELLGQGSRQDLLGVTFNSSYLEAIARDLRMPAAASVAAPEPRPELNTRTPAVLVKLGSWTPDDDADLPRSGYGYRPDMTPRELYDAARAWWVMDPVRAAHYPYVAAVAGGLIVGVWEVNHGAWRSIDGSRHGRAAVRWAFEGQIAPPEVQQQFLGRVIPAERPDGGRVFGSGSVVAYWPR